jgi:ketosteroid isomerase-like protein
LKGIGHLPHLEAYQQVNKMVREFFGASAKAKSNQKALTDYEKNVYRQIDSLIQYQEQLVLKQDTLAMRAFYPDDMVITNPFGQMINKETTIARVKSGIIKYSKFEKIIEHFAMEGSKTAIVAGLEKVTPTPDASRADAGKPHERRFTEIWVYRDGRWQRLIRHASNI